MFTMPWKVRLAGACAVAALAGLILTDAACAQTAIRLGKAQANHFAFVPADVGVDTGIFKEHGIDLEISAFRRRREAGAGDVREHMVALGGGPAFSPSWKVRR